MICFKRNYYVIVMLVAWLTMTGCFGGQQELHVRFDHVKGLHQGAEVRYEQNRIGEVDQVSATSDQRFIVTLRIEKDFKNLLTEHARFYITENANDASTPLVEMVLMQTGGQPLEDGATIEGSEKAGAMWGRFMKNLTGQIESMRDEATRFAQEIRSMAENEALHRLEQEIDQLSATMRDASEDVRNQIREQVLPQLRQQLEALRKRLEALGRGKEVVPLDVRLKQMESV